jgi:Ser/Thr protein kinase RdoA (MazF antagonist)
LRHLCASKSPFFYSPPWGGDLRRGVGKNPSACAPAPNFVFIVKTVERNYFLRFNHESERTATYIQTEMDYHDLAELTPEMLAQWGQALGRLHAAGGGRSA